MYPIWFVILAIVAYLLAYYVYAKWYDRKVWEPDPKRATPAHMYMDGITFFPVSKYVLYGFQFKGIAGLGPILGPFIALYYGWIPALIWIILGNFFIGWIHDYTSLFLSVRNDGKSMGPLSYELISPRTRTSLLGFLFFYLILIIAVFAVLCSLFFQKFPETVLATVFLYIGGIVSGLLLYKARTGVITSTIIGLIITAIGIVVGMYFPLPYPKLELWIVFTSVLLFIGATISLMYVTQPITYIASYPCLFGIILLILGALISPWTNVPIQQTAWGGFLGTTNDFWNPGPIWPLLTVSVACGAISGWHSLLSTSGSAPQLDVETDALPVAAGSMLTEGLLALASVAAYMVLTPADLKTAGGVNWAALVLGAVKLVSPYTGGAAAAPWIRAFFGMWLETFAITIGFLAVRFFWLVWADVVGGKSPVLGNKYVGAIIGLVIADIFAYTGAWQNIWLLFGGSNQLLAGLALTLVTVYLAKLKKPTAYTFWPAIFMIITCEAALLFESAVFFRAVVLGKPIATGMMLKYPSIALTLNAIFGIVGLVLFALGLIVAWDGLKRYSEYKKAVSTPAAS